MSGKLPQWATPQRRDRLVELFVQSRGFCVFGEEDCPRPEDHFYEFVSEELIEDWKGEDREERARQWRQEQRRMHASPQIRRRGPFDSVARWEYLGQRPVFQIVAVGVNAFSQRRVAQVEIPGLGARIWVDISGVKAIGKNRFRKLVRYQRGSIPTEIEPQINAIVDREIRRYL